MIQRPPSKSQLQIQKVGTNMRVKHKQFARSALAIGVATCLQSGLAMSQETQAPAADMEIIQVNGVRGSQVASISLKRAADSVVDGISAEDIGKLPDVTISDSLQRISGIQIRRSAGEGASVNIRGLPQVITQLNGEQYLGANSVVSTQPNFNDIPSQLFKGAEVYKSSTADLGASGITGTVNLKTYRPFDFDPGTTFAINAEAQYGDETQQVDPVLSGLININKDKYGFLLAATYANVNLSNSYNGVNTNLPGDAGWTSQFTDAQVGLADMGRRYMGSQGFAAWNQETERERLGVNASFQAELGEGFTLTLEGFYTSQEEYNRKVGMSVTNKWQGNDWFVPTVEYATNAFYEDDTGNREFYAWTQAELDAKRLKSFSQNDIYDSSSHNINLQLDYDNGGAFTGQFRAVLGKADRKKRHGYNEGDLTDGSTTLGRTTNFVPATKCTSDDDVVGAEGGCLQAINPLGYSENLDLTYDTTGEHPTWSGFDRQIDGGLGAGHTLADYMANLDSYNVGAFSSENNENAEGDFKAFSLKGNYAFSDGFITSVDAGVRLSNRSASFERYNLFSPVASGACEAQWKATDVLLEANDCSDGELVDGVFTPYAALEHVALDAYSKVKYVTDFGPVNGIPGIWAVDPTAYDDPEAFHNRVFGATSKHILPGSSFDVDMDELSFFLQANFEGLDGKLTGNLGLRVIETDLNVKQNIAGNSKPFGNTAYDTGDLITKRSYTDVLPALNLAYELGEDVVMRFAYTENMTPLDLNKYGEGLTLNTALDSNSGSPTFGQFIVTYGTLAGNPELDPWRSTNYDLSLEWYLGEASMLSAGLFKIDIESFTTGVTISMPQPDADGVIRRNADISTLVQGEGGSLEGIELGAKLAFDDLFGSDSLVSNFGVDANYTYSPSESSAKDIYGDDNMFPDNSEHQFNLIGWYQADKWQARIAYNYRSERLAAEKAAGNGVLNLYQTATTYVDASVSYDINEDLTVYLNGSNITGEFEDYYAEFKQQYAFQNYYEARYTLGVRAKF